MAPYPLTQIRQSDRGLVNSSNERFGLTRVVGVDDRLARPASYLDGQGGVAADAPATWPWLDHWGVR